MAGVADSCSALSLHVPLLGSAPHRRLWVMVDCPKPWAPKVQKSKAFPEGPRRAIDALLDRGLELAVVGRAAAGAGVTCYRPHGGAFMEASVTDLSLLAEGRWGELEWSWPQPTVYVCTHGSRDSCCGRLGVPVWQAWSGQGEEVLECSHLGGHRFAATVLVFPEGRVYGRVEASSVDALRQSWLRGDAEQLRWLRGHSAYSPALQVVEAEMALRNGRFPRWLSLVSATADILELEGESAEGRPWSGRATLAREVSHGPQSCSDVPEGRSSETELLRLTSLEVTGR